VPSHHDNFADPDRQERMGRIALAARARFLLSGCRRVNRMEEDFMISMLFTCSTIVAAFYLSAGLLISLYYQFRYGHQSFFSFVVLAFTWLLVFVFEGREFLLAYNIVNRPDAPPYEGELIDNE
jgi:hypothetical protein